MTYAAACTQRLRLGCVVFVSTLHNPVHLAKSLSTLDQLSRGRIEIGVGTGGQGRPFAAFGVDPGRYVARFTEGLALMKALWTESRVTFDGEFWQLKDAAMEPKPFQKPYPPIWFGGDRPGRAAARGPRWATVSSARDQPTAKFAEPGPARAEALAESGREPAISRSPSASTSRSTPTPGRARRDQRELERLYGRRSADIEAAAIAGTPADCVRELRKVADGRRGTDPVHAAVRAGRAHGAASRGHNPPVREGLRAGAELRHHQCADDAVDVPADQLASGVVGGIDLGQYQGRQRFVAKQDAQALDGVLEPDTGTVVREVPERQIAGIYGVDVEVDGERADGSRDVGERARCCCGRVDGQDGSFLKADAAFGKKAAAREVDLPRIAADHGQPGRVKQRRSPA